MSRPSPDPVCILRGEPHPVMAACFGTFNGDKCLIVSDSDENVCVWSLKTNRIVSSFKTDGPCLWLACIQQNRAYNGAEPQNGMANETHTESYNQTLTNTQTSIETVLITQSKNGFVTSWIHTNNNWMINHQIRSSDVGFCSCDFVTFEGETRLAIPMSGKVILCDPCAFQSISQNHTDDAVNVNNLLKADSKLIADDKVKASDKVKVNDKVKANKNISMYDQQNSRDLSTDKVLPNPNEKGNLMCLTNIPNMDCIAMGYEDGSFALWDMQGEKLVDSLKIYSEPVMCVRYCENKGIAGSVTECGKGIAGSVTDEVIVWSVVRTMEFSETGDDVSDNYSYTLKQLDKITITNPGVNDIAIRNDGKIFALACWDGKIRVFSFKTHKPLAVLSSHTKSVNCVVFQNDGILAATSNDGTVSIWDIYNR